MQLSREHCLLGQESGKEHLAYYGTVWYGVRHSSRHSGTAHYSHHEHTEVVCISFISAGHIIASAFAIHQAPLKCKIVRSQLGSDEAAKGYAMG